MESKVEFRNLYRLHQIERLKTSRLQFMDCFWILDTVCSLVLLFIIIIIIIIIVVIIMVVIVVIILIVNVVTLW